MSETSIAEPILHVDMDAFFVEVERRRDSNLLGKPVVVGGLGRRGVVSTASYEARELGVGSAMPMATARRLAPHAVYVAPDHQRYTKASREVFEVFSEFTHLVEGLSVDEAFLDVGGLRLHYEEASTIADAIRQRLRDKLGLPASVGAATTKFLAKVASDMAKPDGVLVVSAGEELGFLRPLPVGRLWGVGPATKKALDEIGVVTIGELADLPEGILERRLGDGLGQHLRALASGVDPRTVDAGRHGAKSISVEQTYSVDLVGRDEIERALVDLTDRLARRLHRANAAGRTVTLKVRFGDFTTVTRSTTEQVPVHHPGQLRTLATALLEKTESGRRVRLLGIGVSGISAESEPLQMELDSAARDAAADAANEVRDRFGDDAVRPARLVEPPPRSPRIPPRD
ncbi:MAG: DNA polymerase IV [Acidimicrobiia bacterium]|nr:DNA polymerase IV [Acidimicrobiia bacterium]NNC75486.1 DNA polymerase IV [Acidimicrobiia bacterium]